MKNATAVLAAALLLWGAVLTHPKETAAASAGVFSVMLAGSTWFVDRFLAAPLHAVVPTPAPPPRRPALTPEDGGVVLRLPDRLRGIDGQAARVDTGVSCPFRLLPIAAPRPGRARHSGRSGRLCLPDHQAVVSTSSIRTSLPLACTTRRTAPEACRLNRVSSTVARACVVLLTSESVPTFDLPT